MALRKAATVFGASCSSKRASKVKSPARTINLLMRVSQDRIGSIPSIATKKHLKQGPFQPSAAVTWSSHEGLQLLLGLTPVIGPAEQPGAARLRLCRRRRFLDLRLRRRR